MNKYIVSHTVAFAPNDVTTFCNGFIISNSYNFSLTTFDKLFEIARQSFPDLKREDAECRRVTESGWCKDCAVLRFPLPAYSQAEGWQQRENFLPDAIIS